MNLPKPEASRHSIQFTKENQENKLSDHPRILALASIILGSSEGPALDDRNPDITLGTLNYGNYGVFLIMGTAECI